jgi:nucleolin
MEGIPFHATYEQIVDFLTRSHDTGTNNNNNTTTEHMAATATATATGSIGPTQRSKIQRSEIIDIRLPVWQDTGRYRGYGHVVFTTKEIQQLAIRHLHQQYFFVNITTTSMNQNNHDKSQQNNRYISITQAKSKSSPSSSSSNATLSDPSKTILLRNLSYLATEEDVHDALERLNASSSSLSFTTPSLESGQIRIVRHTIPPYRSKGMAYITFPTLNDAIHCITCIQQRSSTSPFSICQRTITHFDYDHGRIKGSFRTAQHTFWSTTYRNSSNSNNNDNHEQQPRSLKNRLTK